MGYKESATPKTTFFLAKAKLRKRNVCWVSMDVEGKETALTTYHFLYRKYRSARIGRGRVEKVMQRWSLWEVMRGVCVVNLKWKQSVKQRSETPSCQFISFGFSLNLTPLVVWERKRNQDMCPGGIKDHLSQEPINDLHCRLLGWAESTESDKHL